MAFDFYDYLYNGYTGEYQLVSALYRNGLDAVRPPADMGIDVVSLNLKEQLKDPATTPETFFFQVKTALTAVRFDEKGRSTGIAEFKLKESEVELLCQGVGRVLMCYVYTRENDSLTDSFETPFCCFWIDGERLRTIFDGGALFIAKGDTKLTLRCKLTLPPYKDSHWYAMVVDSQGNQAPEGYLGTIDSDDQATSASDGADHYSVRGYLKYARERAAVIAAAAAGAAGATAGAACEAAPATSGAVGSAVVRSVGTAVGTSPAGAADPSTELAPDVSPAPSPVLASGAAPASDAACAVSSECTLFSDNAKAARAHVLESMAKRGVTRFVHFTEVDNLESIMMRGLMPLSLMNGVSKEESALKLSRYEGTDAICLSVEFPNYRTFYHRRCVESDKKWCVLLLDARKVIERYEPQFYWTNAASKSFLEPHFNAGNRNDPGSAQAFDGMFYQTETPNRFLAVTPRTRFIPDKYPTNPQAEIQIYDKITPDCISLVVFEDQESVARYQAAFSFGAPACTVDQCEVNYFAPRADWQEWRGEGVSEASSEDASASKGEGGRS